MSRAALTKTNIVLVALAVVVAGGGGAVAYRLESRARQVRTVWGAQHQVTQLSYAGLDGVDALTLLRRHASVGLKHYSFGDEVTSIDGSAGTGPKYWTFYINGKQATTGAGSYLTHASDTLLWKLQ